MTSVGPGRSISARRSSIGSGSMKMMLTSAAGMDVHLVEHVVGQGGKPSASLIRSRSR